MKRNNTIIAGAAAYLVLILSPGIGRCAAPGFFIPPSGVSAQDTLPSAERHTELPAAADSSSVDSTTAGRGHWVGFPVAFYTPETGFGGGLAAGYIFPRRGVRHPSSIMGIAFYTEKEQSLIALAPELYLEGGFHGLMEVGYQKFPDSYWGIGPDTEDGDEEGYTPELVQTRLIGELEFYPGLRAGLQFRYMREVILETEEGGQLEDRTVPGSTGGTMAGAGILGTYDSRDNRFSSSAGWYIYLSHTTYGRALLSDYSYTSIMLDVRKFFPVLGSHVFATRLYSRSTSGTVPFQELPYLGGQNAMRGYQAGRYRDKLAAYAQAEYRVPFVWVTSLAVFGSAGCVSPDIGSFSFDRMKYAGGGGIRFRLNKERFSLRFDYAVTGDGGSNFYVSANEAF